MVVWPPKHGTERHRSPVTHRLALSRDADGARSKLDQLWPILSGANIRVGFPGELPFTNTEFTFTQCVALSTNERLHSPAARDRRPTFPECYDCNSPFTHGALCASRPTFARACSGEQLQRIMKAEYKIQLALAVLGVPSIFYLWRPDSKWPNPFALQPPSQDSPTRGERFLSYLGLQPPRKPPQ